MTEHFIIVDDDRWSNEICAFNIKKALKSAQTMSFILPEEALAYIETVFINHLQPTVLFLDINMPLINGWEFLHAYAKFGDDIKRNITIYMLSSSISPWDEEKANLNEHVKAFVSKPLTIQKFRSLFNNES